MKKIEAIQAVKDKWGFLPYGGILFELWKDDDDIPQHVVDYELNTNPHKSPGTFIVASPQVAKALNDVIKNVDHGDVDHIDGVDDYPTNKKDSTPDDDYDY